MARAVTKVLRSNNLIAWTQEVAPPILRFVRILSDGALFRGVPDLAFNLVEGFGGRSGGEAWITSVLELRGLPYTGCPPEAQALCRQKGRTKALLHGLDLPTAPFVILEPGGPAEGPGWDGPSIVKPESEDGSLGIDQGSVVADPEALRERIGHVRAKYGPRVLVEAYLPGPEYNVGVLDLGGPVALPVAEILHDPAPGQWPILTYDAKWAAGSAADRASPVRCPAGIDGRLADRLGGLAVAAFRATGCRDVARVDFRLDPRGEPMILEVNPNPDLGPTAGWARALRVSGRDYGGVLAALARQAIRRG